MSLLPVHPHSTPGDSRDVPDGTPVRAGWALYDNEQDSLVVYPKEGPLDYEASIFTGDGTSPGLESSWYAGFHDYWIRPLSKLPIELKDETLRAWQSVVNQAHKVCQSGNVPYRVWPTSMMTHTDHEGRSILSLGFEMDPQDDRGGEDSANEVPPYEGFLKQIPLQNVRIPCTTQRLYPSNTLRAGGPPETVWENTIEWTSVIDWDRMEEDDRVTEVSNAEVEYAGSSASN